ncbi:MAG TPA: hypothetical protein VFB45_27335 [Pseudolabrys sp.]|nr:hypothetical protein [Pseudolabrys sp.]
MKKSALILVAALALSLPTVALAKKKAAEPANPNANGEKYVSDLLMTPVVMANSLGQPATAPAPAVKKHKKKKMKKM